MYTTLPPVPQPPKGHSSERKGRRNITARSQNSFHTPSVCEASTHVIGNSPESFTENHTNSKLKPVQSVLFTNRNSGHISIRNVLARNRNADAQEIVKNLFGAAFASLTVSQQLTTLERECHVAEAECRFRDAQVCNDLLNQIAQTCEIHARRVIQDKMKKLEPLRQKQEVNREELVQFTIIWEKAMQDFDAKAEVAINEMKTRHSRVQQENEQLLQSQLASLQPHYSRQVLDLRLELKKLLVQRQFIESDGISKDLMAVEEKEKRKFYNDIIVKFEKKNKEIRDAHQLEIMALKKRVFQAREELICQRREDYQTIISRHMIQSGKVDRVTRGQLHQDHKYLQRQAVVMARRPANAVDLFYKKKNSERSLLLNSLRKNTL